MRSLPYGADWPSGTVIEMYGDRLRIRKSRGSYGVVESLNGDFECSRYYWEFQGDRAVVVSAPALPNLRNGLTSHGQ